MSHAESQLQHQDRCRLLKDVKVHREVLVLVNFVKEMEPDKSDASKELCTLDVDANPEFEFMIGTGTID